MSLPAKVTITIDNTYEVVSQQVTRNVVGMVEGTDPKLKDTYVMFGAHLDHVGYSQTGGGAQPTPIGVPAAQRGGAGGGHEGAGRRSESAGAAAARGAGTGGAAPPRRALRAARRHQQRRRRRRVGIGRRCWRLPRRSPPARSRSDRWCSSGTPARNPGCTARATTPIFRSCRSTRSRRSSIWTWSAATTATTSRATTRNTRVHRRRRPHQHRSAQPDRPDERDARRSR